MPNREDDSLPALLQKNKDNLHKLLEGHPSLTADRLIQLFWAATQQSYALAKCDPGSLIAALLTAAAVGVEVNTPLQHAVLVPRKGFARFQLMYRGWMHLGRLHGGLLDWRADAVYGADEFRYRPSSSSEPIIHEPNLEDPHSAANLRGAYSLVFLPGGIVRAKWMSIAEIRAIRDRYSESWKAYQADPSKDDTPWLWREGEMSIKTVVINQGKQLQMTGPPPVTLVNGTVFDRGPRAALQLSGEDEAEVVEDYRYAPQPPHKTAAQPPPETKPPAMWEELKARAIELGLGIRDQINLLDTITKGKTKDWKYLSEAELGDARAKLDKLEQQPS